MALIDCGAASRRSDVLGKFSDDMSLNHKRTVALLITLRKARSRLFDTDRPFGTETDTIVHVSGAVSPASW